MVLYLASRNTGEQLADRTVGLSVQDYKISLQGLRLQDYMFCLQNITCSKKCLIPSARGGLVAYLASRDTGGQLADRTVGFESTGF